jgi:Mg2+ and Co2+ transporter CorA
MASSVLPMLEGFEDLIKNIVDIQKAMREDDSLSNAQIYNTFNTLSTMMVGVDMNTFVNIGDGIADIANGDWMEGTLDILNVPNSQVKLLVGDRKADESWEEYMTRILRVRSLLDKNKVEAAEAAKYNPTTQGWEPEPSITEAQKRDITKMYKQYENAYQQDVLKKHRPNMEWSDTEKRYEEVVKEIGWSPNENPNNEEPKVELSTEVLNTLRYLQGHNAAMNKLKARFVGSDEEYAKYLDTIYQDRKQLIQLYDDNVK